MDEGLLSRAGLGRLWLAGRMLSTAIALRALKHVVPLPALVRLASRHPSRRPLRPEQVSSTATALFSRLGHGMTCLERSVVLFRFLSAAGASPELVTGLRLEEGRVEGHAWVLLSGKPVGEVDASVERFAPILRIAAAGSPALSVRS